MGNSKAALEYIQSLGIAAHIESKEQRAKNASGFFKPTGKHGYFYKGKEISEKEFNSRFPIVELRKNINQFATDTNK